jgi:hypothetical protein
MVTIPMREDNWWFVREAELFQQKGEGVFVVRDATTEVEVSSHRAVLVTQADAVPLTDVINHGKVNGTEMRQILHDV